MWASRSVGMVLVTASAAAYSTAGLFTRLLPLDVWTILFWPLYNSVYPVPQFPGSLWPYIVLAWIVKLGLFRLVQVRGSHELCFSNPTRLGQAILDAGRD